MLFSNNDRRDEISVNTGVTTLWSPLSSLNIGCWNDKISLSWMPASGKNERGATTYNKERKIQTALPYVKINALLKRYDKTIKEKYENGEEPPEDGINVGVPITSKDDTKIIMIEYKKDEKGTPGMYLTIAEKIGENGVSGATISYKFNRITTLENYRPSTGAHEDVEDDGEFEFFIDILRAHVLMTGLNSHATRYSDAFKKNRSGGGNGGAGADAGMMNIPDNYAGGEFPFP